MPFKYHDPMVELVAGTDLDPAERWDVTYQGQAYEVEVINFHAATVGLVGRSPYGTMVFGAYTSGWNQDGFAIWASDEPGVDLGPVPEWLGPAWDAYQDTLHDASEAAREAAKETLRGIDLPDLHAYVGVA